MKYRMLSIAALIVIALFTVIPTFAQDEVPTIAEIVVASTEAEEAQFTTLLAAVSAADPAVLELLSNPDASVTVFAPTDGAFEAALAALGVTAEDLLADTDMLTNILLYHVVPGVYTAESVVALDGALIGTMSHEGALAISLDDMGVAINEAHVITTDITAFNGIVHVIDGVLLPPDTGMMEDEMMEAPTSNIAETVIASAGGEAPEFATLLAAVQAADPAILATLTGAGPYTVFAPTDAAFAAALEALGLTAEELLADTATLTSVLAYHVVPGYFSSPTVVAVAGAEGGVNLATALPGTTVNVSLDGESVKVNEATVIATDVAATNGIIHVIDAVILPPM